MTSRKRSNDDLDEKPHKRAKMNQDQDVTRIWAVKIGIAKSQADYLTKKYTVQELLAMTEAELLRDKTISRPTHDKILTAQNATEKNSTTGASIVVSTGVRPSTRADITAVAAAVQQPIQSEPSGATQSAPPPKAQYEKVQWLYNFVMHLPKSAEVSDVLTSIGGKFSFCVSQETKKQIYNASLSSFNMQGPTNKENYIVPFINGAPGIGKTRMLLEMLNMLKDCAQSSNETNDNLPPTTIEFHNALLSKESILLYVSYANDTRVTNSESKFMRNNVDISASIIARILYKYYSADYSSLADIDFAGWESLTLKALMAKWFELGAKYIVLAIDEMNTLHQDHPGGFSKLIKTIASAVGESQKKLFVAFAGTIHSPLKTVIRESLGLPLSISPALLSGKDIAAILDGLANTAHYLKDWRNSKLFQRCLVELSNPPRVLDTFLALVQNDIAVYHDLDHLTFSTIKTTLLSRSQISTPGAENAPALVRMCLTKQIVSLDTKLPDGVTVEEGARRGFIFFSKMDNNGVQIAIPLVYLMSWLAFENYLAYAHQLFADNWNDSNAIGPYAWEIFNVKHTAFKMSALTPKEDKSGLSNIVTKLGRSMSLRQFHSGAQFGSDCDKFSVDLRITVPVQLLQQFPASFPMPKEEPNKLQIPPGDVMSPPVTSLLDGRAINAEYKYLVCLNGQNTPGIDAFYWLSDDVVEVQQYKANVVNSKNPTMLEQAELDNEYNKAKDLCDKYLVPHGIKWVFGMISNQTPSNDLKLQPNAYLVHQQNMVEYFGPTFASLAQIKSFTTVNVNLDPVPQLMRIIGVDEKKAKKIIDMRKTAKFDDLQDFTTRVKRIQRDQQVFFEF